MTKEPRPSQNAINALQSNVIGGPLKACIEAQKEQAKKDWQFVEDPKPHNKEAKDK